MVTNMNIYSYINTIMGGLVSICGYKISIFGHILTFSSKIHGFDLYFDLFDLVNKVKVKSKVILI